MKIEEQIQALLGDELCVRRDLGARRRRGERLVAFYTDPDPTRTSCGSGSAGRELPRLWLPKREDLHLVESIPTLGTGKVDLRAVRQLALEIAGSGV